MSSLKRELGVPGATLLGLGSILGTGVFVSIGLGASIAGAGVVLAIAIAAVLATCNALSSAQLAAAHPVSGGTYEYGYRLLAPPLGFAAGWMFLCAKSASAATAALGFAGYLLYALGGDTRWLIPVAVTATVVLVVVVLLGVRRANWLNAVIVTTTIVALAAFIVAGIPSVTGSNEGHLDDLLPRDEAGGVAFPALLHASALMFVAYTGYGRIATMGEEIRSPRRSIPRAIISTLVVSGVLYVGVAVVLVGAIGADGIDATPGSAAAPLEVAARSFSFAQVHWLIALGAITAMLGVLLNLILGLSRVLLAMGRRGDMPARLARISGTSPTPVAATIVVGIVIATLTATGSVKTTWSFSAFTVLVYYAVTNLAALRLPRADRLYPAFVAWGGLAGCLGLAFFVERGVWLAGLGMLGVGLVWHAVARRIGAGR